MVIGCVLSGWLFEFGFLCSYTLCFKIARLNVVFVCVYLSVRLYVVALFPGMCTCFSCLYVLVVSCVVLCAVTW